jgi:tryptophan-rich sensory protein
MKRLVPLLLLAGCVALAFLPGILGSRFAPGEWYARLVKPALTPPGWVFPVAWTLLYLSMGVALFLVLRAAPLERSWPALTLFGAQLALNGAWSWLFFGLERPGLALAEIVTLLTLIAATAVAFWRLRPAAGALLLPYLAWVAFATYLNAGFWWLNRPGSGT